MISDFHLIAFLFHQRALFVIFVLQRLKRSDIISEFRIIPSVTCKIMEDIPHISESEIKQLNRTHSLLYCIYYFDIRSIMFTLDIRPIQKTLVFFQPIPWNSTFTSTSANTSETCSLLNQLNNLYSAKYSRTNRTAITHF